MVYDGSQPVGNSESRLSEESDISFSNVTADSRRHSASCLRITNGSGRYLQVVTHPPSHLSLAESLEDCAGPPLSSLQPFSCLLLPPDQSPNHLAFAQEGCRLQEAGSSGYHNAVPTTPVSAEEADTKNALLVPDNDRPAVRGSFINYSSSSEHVQRFLAEKQRISLSKGNLHVLHSVFDIRPTIVLNNLLQLVIMRGGGEGGWWWFIHW